jgi:hypothetical protein
MEFLASGRRPILKAAASNRIYGIVEREHPKIFSEEVAE